MATNLTTKGVSGASASDGLTTLTSKINSIISINDIDMTYTNTIDAQIPLPSDFEITTEFYMGAYDHYCQVYIGTELGVNNIAFGNVVSGYQGWEFKKNNTRLTLAYQNFKPSLNTWYTVKVSKEGNNYTLECNNSTLTYTNSTIIPSYIFLIYLPDGKCRNIRIKEL